MNLSAPPTALRARRFLCLSLAALCATQISVFGQSTEPSPAASNANDVVELSPFQVSTTSDEGYAARETLAGSRVKTNLKDVPAQISIMTKEFLDDIASVDIDDAYRYSVNVENTKEYQSATIGGGDFNSGVINIFNNNRVRGLTAPGRTHDFFLTNIPGDTYNSERVTFSSGPNSILFGNGNPAGIIDNSFKRADPSRNKYAVSLRVDDDGSARVSADLNQVLWEDKLAVRVAAVKADNHEPRDPAGSEIERYYAALTFRPFQSTTIRAYFEDVYSDRTVARNTLVGDNVTPWIEAGRPTFNNGLVNPDPIPAASDPLFLRHSFPNQSIFLFGETETDVFSSWGSSGALTAGSTYSVVTKGPGQAPYQTGTNSYNYSLLDPSISPRTISINGADTRNIVDAEVMGVILEQRIGQNLFIEAGFNQESLVNPVADYLRGIHSAIRADANMFLPDRVTPNPNLGKYYVEGNGRGRVWIRDSRESRVMASYDLDLRDHSKWLGRHRIAALYQRVHEIGAGQEMATRVVPAGTSFDEALANYGSGVYNTLFYRSYLSDPTDKSTGSTYFFDLPFDPFDSFVLPDGSTAWTHNNPYGGSGSSTITHTLLEGKLLAVNNYFWEDRIATSFGWRTDNVRAANRRTERQGGSNRGAWESILNIDQSNDWSVFTSGDTFTGGAVVHVMPWLSLFYNESSTWNPPRVASHNPDDSVIGGSIGDGNDYGVMLRFFDNRLSLRINKYENTSGPDISSFRTQILPQIIDIEETIFDAAEAGQIPSYPSAGAFNPQVDNNFYYDVISDQVSKGYEFEIVANPTRNWRIALNGAKARATESNIALPWIEFVNDRIDIWRQYPDLAGPASEGQTETVRNRVLGLTQTLNVIKQSEGQRSHQQREWRVNLLTRYAFDEGVLKGAFVGGGYRWRSKATIGYQAVTVANEFPFPGVPDDIVVPSVSAPIHGAGNADTELFFGYSRKLNDRMKWKVQLNIRNVLGENDLLGQRANTDGDITVYTVPQPRRFILTNTLEF